MKRLDLPPVARVHTPRGSHIEPPLNPAWDEPTKLAWCAAAVAHDTGLAVTVHDEAATDADGNTIPGRYAIGIGHTSHSAMDYRDAWTYLSGVVTGFAVAVKETR